jgi:YYY domain-containing protein
MNTALASAQKTRSVHPWIARFLSVRTGLAIVLLAAALFRFYGLNWDSGRNLHPDERFLTSVTNDLTWPESLDSYFDPLTSTLSPYSLPNMGLFVYGTLPVYLVKWAAILLDQNTYAQIPLVGRALSGLFDLGSIFFLFLIGRRLYGERTGLLAAALLAVSVLNIQLSHFYAVDTFSNLFVVAAFYFVLRASASGRWRDYALTGLLFGLGLSSKVSIATLAVPILIGGAIDFHRQAGIKASKSEAFEHSLVRLVTVFGLAALTFRLLQPAAFAGPSFWNWSLNPLWQRDMLEQSRIAAGMVDLPWVRQWIGRTPMYALYNLMVWGLGLPFGLAAAAGFGFAAYELIRRRKLEHLLPAVFVALVFVYHAATFVKFMRYFLPLYPFLALLAAYLITSIWQSAAKARSLQAGALPGPSWVEKLFISLSRLLHTKAFAAGIAVLVLGGTLLYAIAFSSIYSRHHTRIEASRWMYANIPPGSTLANEHWDDWLPIGGLDGNTAYGDEGMFVGIELANYEDDTPEKLDRLVENLEKADYVMLSSNRLSDSIPRLPVRYPMTSRYYELLFQGEIGFEPLVEFTSYPALFGVQFPDQQAEESFHVYDHPRVRIFKKSASFDPDQVRGLLAAGVDWEAVTTAPPRQASAAMSGMRLSPAEQQRYRETATWTSTYISPESWGSRLPVLAWVLAIQLLGLLALPLTLLAFRNLADRGYILSKGTGLLIAGWGAWMIASLRLAPFTLAVILVVMALLALGSWLLFQARRAELIAFLREKWKLLAFEEGLFWGLFLLLLLIRWSNPDLWHPSMGGEKPMDLAYLTAIVRTPYFPPYDPWFAGGYINYYYFGFILTATLIHLTGIVPVIAYNLAVPAFYAMTAMGAFTAAYNLAGGRQSEQARGPGIRTRRALIAGLCGVLFVAMIGNLGQVQLLFDAFRKLSVIQVEGNTAPLVMLAQFVDGLGQWFEGARLEIRTEWWYWNATRVIPAGPGEAGPINEIPFFTFLYGDLHAHMMALPYTLVALVLAVNLLRGSEIGGDAASTANPNWLRELPGLGLLALVIGSLWTMNTWDLPTYALLAAAALAYREYARRQRVDAAGIWAVAWRTALMLAGAWVLFLPFHQAYTNSFLGAELWRGTRTPLWAYLIIHGFFLFIIVSYLAVELMKSRRQNPVARTLKLMVHHHRRLWRLRDLFKCLTRPLPGYYLAIRISALAVVLAFVVFSYNRLAGLVLGLILLTLLLLLNRPEPHRQFGLTLIGLGLALTLVVEFIVLKSDISRMNTVFKFYLQVWVMWGIASAALLPELVSRLKTSPAGGPNKPGGWKLRTWQIGFGVLLAACLLYPLTATPVRISDRFEGSRSNTLDGGAYMLTSMYSENDVPFKLEWDQYAMDWLQRNVRGLPVIVEANTSLYRWGSRISIYTGLPTVIGWDWHQKQQRAALPGDMIDRRTEDVGTIYTSQDIELTVQLLERYNIRYIYVGPLERIYYGEEGLSKFEAHQGQYWNLVYGNEEVKIYETTVILR